MTDIRKAKGNRRRLDHLADMQDGEPFAMIPQRLLRLWIDKKFPDSKFRLLCCFLTNAEYFHCKRTFLENRFDAGTLKKYLPELIAEGFLEVEERDRARGGVEKFYHVNSLHDWALPVAENKGTVGQVADPGHAGDRHAGDRHAGDRHAGDLKKINPNEIKENKTKDKVPAQKIPQATASGGGRITKTRLVGMLSALYGQFARRSVMTSLIDEMLDEAPREVVFELLKKYGDQSLGKADLQWDRDSWGLWKAQIREHRASVH